MSKTLHILGAGFSYPAGIPVQGQLIKKIIESAAGFDSNAKGRLNSLLNFIKEIFGFDESQAQSLALEDIYTPIQQCCREQEPLKSFKPQKLSNLETDLNFLISKAIDTPTRADRFDYVDQFSEAIFRNNFPTLSLNWDILLDKTLCRLGYGIRYGIDNKLFGYHPDYASDLKYRRRGLVELIKIHGSLNWLRCPSCYQTFSNNDSKIGIRGFNAQTRCRDCNSTLEASIILPTFGKNLKQLHMMKVWQNAASALRHAEKIVFIGYSFPFSDFEFRSLITKHLPKETPVEVVLHETDKGKESGERYRNYFGTQRCSISYDGVESYVESLTVMSP